MRISDWSSDVCSSDLNADWKPTLVLAVGRRSVAGCASILAHQGSTGRLSHYAGKGSCLSKAPYGAHHERGMGQAGRNKVGDTSIEPARSHACSVAISSQRATDRKSTRLNSSH